MKTINIVHAPAEQGGAAHSSAVQGGFEIEYADLALNFGKASFASTSELTGRSFAALQLRARNAVKALLRDSKARLLILCCSNCADKLQLAQDLVSSLLPAGHKPAVTAIAPSKAEFFGKNDIQGLVQQEQLLIVPAIHLTDHPRWLGQLDAALAKNPELKLIVCGDGSECAELSVLWPAMETALHADVVLEFPASDGLNLFGSLLSFWQQRYGLKPFTAQAVQLLCGWSVRQSGDRRWLALPELKLLSLVREAVFYAGSAPVVQEQHVLKAIGAADFRVNYLAESELRDHRDRQILIATQGAVTGQINGLSVIETYGTSYEYGEPVRITATLRAGGEGDVIDIERKAELAGQIHAKAMMIINGYLTKEFGAEQPLPVSASLVFEQSYSEVDGDSASLTGLCAVLSCLAGVPIRQDLAVTGAVDQFGDVQPVGGVNEKIEGFFRVCRLHGLTGSQGVIIPESCVHQLVLRPAVSAAIKAGKFHIYTVKHVTQAIKILTTVDWGDKEQEDSLSGRIVTRLSEIGMNREDHPWWKFWHHLF